MLEKDIIENQLHLYTLLSETKLEIVKTRELIEANDTTRHTEHYYYKLINLRNHLEELLGLAELRKNGVVSIP